MDKWLPETTKRHALRYENLAEGRRMALAAGHTEETRLGVRESCKSRLSTSSPLPRSLSLNNIMLSRDAKDYSCFQGRRCEPRVKKNGGGGITSCFQETQRITRASKEDVNLA
ncbi:hypothetical protein GW17_00012254 [Ensete ventricosum]|nr:hypothetical protein GW17_00012254 [Ensete ventricosum]